VTKVLYTWLVGILLGAQLCYDRHERCQEMVARRWIGDEQCAGQR
jgi:hypothetical protein